MDSRPLLQARAARRRWASAVIGLVLVAVGVAGMLPAWAAPQTAIRGAGSRAAIPGHYLVIYKHTAPTPPQMASARATTLAHAYGGTVVSAWPTGLPRR
jgi:hypothetical protein